MYRSFHRVWLVVAAVACLLLTAPAAIAQETSGSVEGRLTGPDGEALPGVSVTIRGSGLPGGQTVATNETGRYRLPTVPPGDYTISAQLEGFQPSETPEFRVNLGSQLTVDIPMRLEVGEEILVTGDVPLISITASDTSATISGEWIENLPVGRDFSSLVTQAAGANAEDDKLSGVSIDGSSGSENTWIVDGIDTTNLQTGVQQKELLTDFVEEVQVKYGGYMPEFRASTGGVINAVTKTGGNEFQGSVHAFYENNDFYGDERPSLVDNRDTQLPEYVVFDEDDYDRTEPGFTLGGPIVSDRLWFFVGYSREQQDFDRIVDFTDETRHTFHEDADEDFIVANLSGSAGRLYYRLGANIDDFEQTGFLPARSGPGHPTTGSSDPQDFAIIRDVPGESYTGTLDWLPTDVFQASLRGGHFEYDAQESGFPTGVWLGFSTSSVGTPCQQFPADCAPALERPLGNITPDNTGTLFDLQERDYVQPEGTFFIDQVAGDHELKFGYLNEQLGNEVNDGYSNTRILFYWDTDLGIGDRGQYGVYRVLQINTFGEISSTNQAFFLQDAWRLTDRLTLNLGVRAEKEEVPSYSDDPTIPDPAIAFDYDDKLAPRLGFAYDVMGDGQWKAYGSYGVFYDVVKLEMPRGLFGGDRWIDWFYALDSFDWQSIGDTCRIAPGNTAGDPPIGCPDRLILGPLDRRHPANDPDDPLIDPNLKPMESNEITLGLERLIGNNMMVGARYVRKRLERTIEDSGILDLETGAEIFIISNPGEGRAEFILGPDFPALPKPERDYDAITLSFRRNFTGRWGLNASYTYSELEGNYSGLSSSDEDGRTSPNVNRFFDALRMLYDFSGRPVTGPLGTDRPHQFKAQLIYQLPWGTLVGVDQRVASGVPMSTVYGTFPGLPVFPYGRGDMGRTDTFTQTDLGLTHEFRLGGRVGLQLSLEIFNLFDEDAVTDLDETALKSDLGVSDEDIFFGNLDPNTLPEHPEFGAPRDESYGLAENFQSRRSARLGVKLTF